MGSIILEEIRYVPSGKETMAGVVVVHSHALDPHQFPSVTAL